MSLDDGISFARVRYSSRSDPGTHGAGVGERDEDVGSIARRRRLLRTDVMIESASFADFVAYGTAFTSTREQIPARRNVLRPP